MAGNPPHLDRRRAAGLGLVFGVLAFCQGVAEPTEGLVSQPVQAALTRRGHGPAEVGAFAALVALPWSLKPAFGLLTDFVPLFGRRRQGYLVLAGGLAAASSFGLAGLPSPSGCPAWMLGGLAASTAAWAAWDVASDALMVDRGRDSGLAGRFQAMQWGSAYAAGLLTGVGGGWLSAPGRERAGFAACGVVAVGALLVAAFGVREPRASGPRADPREAARALGRAARSPGLWGVGAFLFLWNFNPFSTVVLRLHVAGTLGLGEATFGATQSATAAGSIAACLGYAWLGGRASPSRLARLSVVLGVASTLACGGVVGKVSAFAVAGLVGVVYMAATLVQLDLAARACPPEAAGTVFALLMAMENLAAASSTALGGWCFERGIGPWGPVGSFRALVLLGAATTAASWLLLPPADRDPGDRGG